MKTVISNWPFKADRGRKPQKRGAGLLDARNAQVGNRGQWVFEDDQISLMVFRGKRLARRMGR